MPSEHIQTTEDIGFDFDDRVVAAVVVSLALVLAAKFFFVGFLFAGSRNQIFYKREEKVQNITVLIPAKDEEDNITDCINALINQSLLQKNIEIIILNDNSSDRTKEIASKFVEEFEHVKLINLEII